MRPRFGLVFSICWSKLFISASLYRSRTSRIPETMKFVEMVMLHSSLSALSIVMVGASSDASAHCRLGIRRDLSLNSRCGELDRQVVINEGPATTVAMQRTPEYRKDLRPSLIGIYCQRLTSSKTHLAAKSHHESLAQQIVGPHSVNCSAGQKAALLRSFGSFRKRGV